MATGDGFNFTTTTTGSASNVIYLNATSAATTTGFTTNYNSWDIVYTPPTPPPQLWIFDDPEWSEDACS
jgi:hypothetical protein